MRTIRLGLLIFCLGCLVGCGQVSVTNSFPSDRSIVKSHSNLTETTIPKIIQELNKQLEAYNPQVSIITPRQNQIFNEVDVKIQLAVADLPIFQDQKLQLGNHVALILDNEPVRKIYDLSEPVILKDLTPGTHTIRVFADRPWGESYKNEGAYAQTTFSVLTETNDNRPRNDLPLLTYSNPTGSYGAEPILLDFYLTNAPLHTVAQNNSQIEDWQIKATVNGDSFILENWQPVYLKGLNKGNNWIQLELIDEAGNDLENVYNNTVRVINYDPQQTDTLSQLVTDQISLAEAQPLIEQNYYIQPVGEPEIIKPTSEITAKEPTVKDPPRSAIEPTVEEQAVPSADAEIAIPQSETNDLEPKLPIKPEVISPEFSTAPEAIINVETKSVPQKIETTQDTDLNDSQDSSSPAKNSLENNQIIAIASKQGDSTEPVATIEIPQPESVEITKDEITITIPPQETITVPEIETQTPVWWKKLLVGLRQKLESLVKLLPSQV